MVSLRSHNRSICGSIPVLLLGLMVACTPVCTAQSPVIQVEEDWELVLDVPDVNSAGPQVACVLSPCGNLDGLYVTFELNHCSAPSFSPGGVHVQVWDGDEHLSTTSLPNAELLATSDERVTWTQRAGLQAGHIVFEILHGQSATWGSFGNEGNLRIGIPSDLENLNNYDPNASRKHSGVTFASHCVKKLTLKTVRLIRADGTVFSVALNYVVHES